MGDPPACTATLAAVLLMLAPVVPVLAVPAVPCVANGFIVLGFRSLGSAGRCRWDASSRFSSHVSQRFDCRGPALFPDMWGPAKMQYWDQKFCGPGLLRPQDAVAARGAEVRSSPPLRGRGASHDTARVMEQGGAAARCRPVAKPDGGDYQFSRDKRRIRFSCRSGLQLQGSRIRVCDADGRWSGRITFCVRRAPHAKRKLTTVAPTPRPTSVPCRPQAKVLHGAGVVGVGGRGIDWTCGPGFQMVGPARSECKPDGSWTAGPICTHVRVCRKISCKLKASGAITVLSSGTSPLRKGEELRHSCSWDTVSHQCICVCFYTQARPRT
jgi:hypothetical protein